MAPQQGYGATGKRTRSCASHTETKQDPRPEEDHAQSGNARSTSWAECRDKKGSAPSRRTEMSLDIPLYRTSPVSVYRACGLLPSAPSLGHDRQSTGMFSCEVRLCKPAFRQFTVDHEGRDATS